MNGYEYILAKQTEWALNRGIDLIGSKVTRGRLAYTPELNQNLFQPLLPQVEESIKAGDGDELPKKDGLPGKIQAVHSSSALGVNVFQYWESISSASEIAETCGFCRTGSGVSKEIRFEDKYAVSDQFKRPPNIDVVIHNKPATKVKRFAIECKFSEAYGGWGHSGLRTKYLDILEIWNDIPALRRLAEQISPTDDEFEYLHPAQLVKHILSLKRHYGKNGFRLLYLWYDVLGKPGKQHRDEVEKFASFAKDDRIKFHAMTFQKLITKLASRFRGDHPEYIHYLTDRYL